MHVTNHQIGELMSTRQRRVVRTASIAALTALAATTLSATTMAPAHAAEEVRGTITDAAGNGVSGYLDIYQYDAISTDFEYYDSSFVGAGRVAATVPPGTYKFRFEPDDSALATEYYLDKTTLGTADAVVVSPTATLSPWVIDAVPFITGVVKSPSGQPLEDVTVTSYDAGTGTSYANAYTDEDGVFKVPANVASAKLRFGGTTDFAGEWYNDKDSLATADPIVPSSAGANVGDVILSPGGQITGVVTSDAGLPLQAIQVCADGSVYRCDLTNAAGVYTVENLTAGTYKVEFNDQSGEYLDEFYNNSPTYAAATDVAVAKGQVVGLAQTGLAPNPVVPVGVDLTGKVLDESGVPVPGVRLQAYTVAADLDDAVHAQSVYTRQDGSYHFTALDGIPNQSSLKVVAYGFENREDDTYGTQSVWSGQVRSYEKATPVALVPGGTATYDFTMLHQGGIAGSITDEAGAALSSGYVTLTRLNDLGAYDYASNELDGTFDERNIEPGTYLVRFEATDHVGEYWNNQPSMAKAKTITVKPGASVTGLNAKLGVLVKALERPELSGYPWVGKELSVDEGVWNTSGAFSVTWLVGGQAKGYGTTYTPTTADIGKKVVAQVTNERGKLSGVASTKASAKVGYQPKVKIKGGATSLSVKVKVKGVKSKKVKGSLVAKEIVKVKANGDPKYKKVGKAKVKKGKATIKLKLQGKGKHKVVFFFTGKGKVGSTEVTKKIKTKK